MNEQTQVQQWLSEGVTKAEIARRLGIPRTTLHDRIERWNLSTPTPPTTKEVVQHDLKVKTLSEKEKDATKKYKTLLEENVLLEEQVEAIKVITSSEKKFTPIKAKKGERKHEGIANVLLSDYHLEERVRSSSVEGLNEYNLNISEARLHEFFQATLRCVEVEQQSMRINHLVLWLLGDLITGWLHEESIHDTELAPVDAAVECYHRLEQGIRFLLDNSDLTITVPCSVGNHGRITRRPNHATENGNSLETFIYHLLARAFDNNERIEFLIPESGFCYVNEFGFIIRGHHGHRVRYQGGVQGIGVPASKKIAQWNRTRPADLDVFGHHHTAQWGENFVVNGSVIGFNSFAYKGGFSFQPPQQQFFVVSSKWGRVSQRRDIYFTI